MDEKQSEEKCFLICDLKRSGLSPGDEGISNFKTIIKNANFLKSTQPGSPGPHTDLNFVERLKVSQAAILNEKYIFHAALTFSKHSF